MSPSERLAAMNETARTTPIPTFYGGDVVDAGETERLKNYVSLTVPYHDTKSERVKLWGVVKDLLAGCVDYKIVYVGDEVFSACNGGAKLAPGWEVWRTKVGYRGRLA